VANAGRFFHGVGSMTISRDGGILGVITDNGFSVVQTNVVRFVPFAALTPRAQLTLVAGTASDSFSLTGTFTLGSSSNGINPPAENATLKVGSALFSIPAGSFQLVSGQFVFDGTIGGVALKLSLLPMSGNSYQFSAQGSGADLTGSTLPLNVGWVVGDDGGGTDLPAGSATLTQ
jgi:hypothetical protein